MRRCVSEFQRLDIRNALFGIVQGGMFEHLRQASLGALVEPGPSCGGLRQSL